MVKHLTRSSSPRDRRVAGRTTAQNRAQATARRVARSAKRSERLEWPSTTPPVVADQKKTLCFLGEFVGLETSFATQPDCPHPELRTIVLNKIALACGEDPKKCDDPAAALETALASPPRRPLLRLEHFLRVTLPKIQRRMDNDALDDSFLN